MSEILIGTSAFTASGWEGSFYPVGMKPADYLSFYATQFGSVELDNTFYRTPAITTVQGWNSRTPAGFVFAAKVPQLITHQKVLTDCQEDLSYFLRAMDALGDKLGPLLFQFGYFNQKAFKSQADFLALLKPFLQNLPTGYKFAVEIRNKHWLDERFLDVLREHGVALALIDQSWVPRPWELKADLDLITANFTYVRWLGDRKGIEERTAVWDKVVVDRSSDLAQWVHLFRQLVSRNLRTYAYANNHYAGHGPATVKLFWSLFEKNNTE